MKDRNLYIKALVLQVKNKFSAVGSQIMKWKIIFFTSTYILNRHFFTLFSHSSVVTDHTFHIKLNGQLAVYTHKFLNIDVDINLTINSEFISICS